MALLKAADTSGVGTKQRKLCSKDCGIAITITDINSAHNSVRRTMRGSVGNHHTLCALNGHHNEWSPMTWLSLGKLGCY